MTTITKKMIWKTTVTLIVIVLCMLLLFLINYMLADIFE